MMLRMIALAGLLGVPVACAQVAPTNAAPPQVEVLEVDTRHRTVDLSELRSGGPPPNGIPPLGFTSDTLGLPDTRPARFETVQDAKRWLNDREPVILTTAGGETGIFPLQVLTWHEIANVTLGGVPVAVTFCPLCNTALVADRRLQPGAEQQARLTDAQRKELSKPVTFGVSGMLYKSDLVMFDSATHTLWYQALGRGLVGSLAGQQLKVIPSMIVSFGEAAAEAPGAKVLSRETGYARDYGRNPYAGYDDIDSPPFLYDGPLDGRLPPKARVVTVTRADAQVAYPFSVLAGKRVVNDAVGGAPLVVLWSPGTASALDASDIAEGRDVGSAGVFDRRVKGRALTFEWRGGKITDRETGSTWNVTGRATAGPLRGERLTPVAHANHFWFAWAAWAPETRLYSAP